MEFNKLRRGNVSTREQSGGPNGHTNAVSTAGVQCAVATGVTTRQPLFEIERVWISHHKGSKGYNGHDDGDELNLHALRRDFGVVERVN